MKKEHIIAGLAVVGAIALYAYVQTKPKKNKEGFYSATGGCGCGK